MMKQMPLLFAVLLSLLLVSCVPVDAAAVSEISVQSEPESPAGDEPESETSQQIPSQPPVEEPAESGLDPQEVALPLPDGYDATDPDKVIAHLAALLESGAPVPEYDLSGLEYGVDAAGVRALHTAYGDSIFCGMPVGVSGCERLPGEGDSSPAVYRLSLTVPEDCGEFLRPGAQTWYAEVYASPYGEGEMTVDSLVHESKYEAMQQCGEDADSLRKICGLREVLSHQFTHPKEIPGELRAGYLLANVPPTGNLPPDNHPYVSQQDMDKWSETLFGQSPFAEETRFCEILPETGEKVYTLAIGWGPGYEHLGFAGRQEEGEYVHILTELFWLPEGESGRGHPRGFDTIPQRTVRYTLRDGIVVAAVDVSDEVGFSPYSDSQPAQRDGTTAQ